MSVPHERRLNPLIRGHRSVAHPWIGPNDAIALRVPGGFVIIEGREEGQEHQHEESSQKGIVDDVEDSDLY